MVLGSGKKPIPGPISRGQKGTGSIPDPDPQYCFQLPASLPPYTNAVKESIYPVQAVRTSPSTTPVPVPTPYLYLPFTHVNTTVLY